MATFAAVTGYRLPAGQAHDSHDLLAVWKSKAPSPRRSTVHNTNEGGYAMRRDNWLLVAAKTGAVTRVPPWFDQENKYPPNTQPGELYDLGQDLAQRNNLYGMQPEKVAELTALLAATRAKGEVR
jgi:arylsulfatase A